MTEPGRKATRPVLLLVEEEDSVRHLLELALDRHGFQLLPAGSGAQAIRVYQKQADVIQMVLMDVRMHGLSGPETLVKLREINPRIRCCFMSGDTALSQTDELLGEGVLHLFRKPFLSLADLASKLHALLDVEGQG